MVGGGWAVVILLLIKNVNNTYNIICLVNASMVGGGWAVVILLLRKNVNNTLSTAGKRDYSHSFFSLSQETHAIVMVVVVEDNHIKTVMYLIIMIEDLKKRDNIINEIIVLSL